MKKQELSVYSVEYRKGRSMTLKRKWFGTYKDADLWMRYAPKEGERDITGPWLHTIVGRRGLVSILTTYAS